jgi:hypothetical protein
LLGEEDLGQLGFDAGEKLEAFRHAMADHPPGLGVENFRPHFHRAGNE